MQADARRAAGLSSEDEPDEPEEEVEETLLTEDQREQQQKDVRGGEEIGDPAFCIETQPTLALSWLATHRAMRTFAFNYFVYHNHFISLSLL